MKAKNIYEEYCPSQGPVTGRPFLVVGASSVAEDINYVFVITLFSMTYPSTIYMLGTVYHSLAITCSRLLPSTYQCDTFAPN